MPFRWLRAALGLSGLWGIATDAIKHAGWRATLVSVVALLWLIALGFCLAGATVWLAAALGPAAALGIVAAAMLVAGLGVCLVLARDAKKARNQPLSSLMAEAKAAAAEDAEEISDDGALQSIAALAFVGYVLGRLARPS